MTDVYIAGAARTAIGSFGGSLKDVSPIELGTVVAREALKRAGIDGAEVEHSVFGQVIQTETRDPYISRVIAIEVGVPHSAGALTVNRLCGSGLQAILSASQGIMLGDAQVALAGGAESMSRAPYILNQARWGMRLGDSTSTDMLVGSLTDPFGRIHMGVTAENVAQKFNVARAEQDALALESHRRASHAIDAGYFDDQIADVTIRQKGKEVSIRTDEHVRRNAELTDFEKLKPAFREGGSVTAGNASGINDGAAALVLASGKAVERLDLKPMARLVSYAFTGVDPAHMGIGPVSATRLALQKSGLTLDDLDVIEANEAFAAQACAVAKELQFDPRKVNPNGSGIALGHPIGATGAINTVKLVYEMQRTGAKYGLVTMCIGGGQGIAAIFQRV